ncbi:Mitotic checkpoint serine/threonine-protein kinase BUB1 [Triplophysa tibetana]|uniref:Mitotic checkpoint serine/threonine-protein kinase BUB1 n=1 Tax=Triplophysa tibetana TaxID=1572043 RepID=A0A5A9NG66_9TELE|nr:Mitotic checkpoint serine/threonine-protein kinase BUB1 [Triplophysa tibetana]
MDIATYFQAFESSVRSYVGDDPLDPWDKFVQFLESKLSLEERKGLSVVLDRLVQTFLHDERYHNDLRYVTHCIKCASFYSDPIEVYSHLHSQGVGTRAAALYMDWALQFEKKELIPQAAAVYQRALENKAQPQDNVLQQYKLFQSRMSANAQTTVPDHVRQPLQNSQLINQTQRQRDAVQTPCKESECVSPAPRTVRVISRSENNPSRAAGSNGAESVSMYCVNELQCEGSELSFEELRARRYFAKCRQQEEQRRLAEEQRRLWEEEEEVKKMKELLEDLEKNVMVQPAEERKSGRLGIKQHCSCASELSAGHAGKSDSCLYSSSRAECVSGVRESGGVMQTFRESEDAESSYVHQIRDGDVCKQSEADDDGNNADTSCGGFSHSHVTPNTSLGFMHATPSRVLPSPTVNTREALGVIMDMFQVPTLLQESMFNSMIQPEDSFEKSCRITGGAASCVKPNTTPFMIYQDTDDQENGGSAQSVLGKKPAVSRALGKISKTSETPLSTEFITDESAVWGARNVSLDPCPNHTRDFALSAHLVSTPLHPRAPHSWDMEQTQEESVQAGGVEGSEDNQYVRPPTKLSPIMEQSPLDDKLSEMVECSMRAQGTIVGEGTALRTDDDSGKSVSAKPSWSIYQSPDKEPGADLIPSEVSERDEHQDAADVLLPKRSFHRRKSGRKPLENQDVLMSPKDSPGLSWLQVDASVPTAEADLDVMMSPGRTAGVHQNTRPMWTIYQSPEKAPEPDFLWAKSPEPMAEQDSDVPSAQEEVQFLLPKKSFQQRRSGTEAVCMLHESLLRSPKPVCEPAPEEPMSPAAGRDRLWSASPPRPTEIDLDVMASPPQCSGKHSDAGGTVSMSPERMTVSAVDVPMSPNAADTPTPGGLQLVSDPWDEDLIASLLSNLQPPLSSRPNLTVWTCRLPSITPKMTVQIAGQSLRVDFVLGQGAFATVYQATNLMSSQKLILKVQKPANPWEFYIDSQLNARLQPAVRHLFNTLYSAHLFTNGSVLIGELHNCGTLLSAINLYKSRSEKVMPQPLVLYFTVCILHMVETLHQANIIHADVKPDNFLLGERFLENECFDLENLEHGLTLLDLGQSIDMTLFPAGTAFTAKCMTSGFQCVEMMSGRPWNYQTDYFGIAGTVYCMIFGTYMQVKNEGGVWKTNGTFKRNVHADLWQNFFHTLLNVPDCGSLPCLRSLRLQLNAVLQENYSSKLRSLKNRLVVQILESSRFAR